MAIKGYRFDRLTDGGYVVYEHGRHLGEIRPDGRLSPGRGRDPKALRLAAQELERRGLIYEYASRASRARKVIACRCGRSQSIAAAGKPGGVTLAEARWFGWRKVKGAWVCPIPHGSVGRRRNARTGRFTRAR